MFLQVELDLIVRTSFKNSGKIPKTTSTIIIKTEELSARKINDCDEITLQLSGINLDIQQGSANPFIDIFKVNNIEASDRKLVYRTIVNI